MNKLHASVTIVLSLLLLVLRQFASQDRYKDHIVHTQHKLKYYKRNKRYPCCRFQ